MSKKVKRGNMEMYSSYRVGDDKARFKYESLLQDYRDLLKESEAKKRKLQKRNQKKQKLFDEVRFLRKRYRKLIKNPSQQKQCLLLKRQSLSIESNPRTNPSVQLVSHAVPAETPSTSRGAALDLNQSSFWNEEDEKTLVCRDVAGTSSTQAGKRKKISWQDRFSLKV